MDGPEAETVRGSTELAEVPRKTRWIVAGVLAVLFLILVALIVSAHLRRRRERAAARHVEALGGHCEWQADPLRWPFDQLPPRLGERFAKLHERLTHIDLDNMKVTDADLAHLKGLTALESLSLHNTQVTDAGLVHLKGLTGLQVLRLDNTQVTDSGLAHLKGLAAMQQLWLNNTQVTGAGLAHLKDLTGLQELWLKNTQVTDASVAELKAALPKLVVER